MSKLFRKTVIATTLSMLLASLAQAAALQTQVFNPGSNSIFPVTSTLITGPTEAVLIDAQFQRNDAQSVLKMIQDSGKKLTTIYVSHGDPDFYFGLDVITAAYPKAKVVASMETIKHIKSTVTKKVAYWGPILKENAPLATVIPTPVTTDTLLIDGEKIKIVGLKGDNPKHTFVWLPTLKTALGGVVVYKNVHVWMADSQTEKSRRLWINTLNQLLALKPDKVIPGHFLQNKPAKINTKYQSVNFTKSYISAFANAAENATDSTALIESMKARYPAFTNIGDLSLSAKVIKKEMQWP
ncbi:MAG: MBL fold metallo-hydrolase [Oceanospirillaceae bacterium]